MKHQVPVEKGKTYELQIHTLGTSGEGVGRYEDFTVFVPNALPGEIVRAEIDEVKKTYARGHVVEILKASKDRVEPVCPIYAQCGGCQLMHLDYMAQLRAKRQQVIDAITRIGKQTDVPVLPTLGAATPWNYRNKMQFPIGRVKGQTVIGCFAQGSHAIIDTTDCRIQAQGNNAIVNAVRDVATKLNISVYNEDRHTGVLRHVMGRVGLDGDMVVLVTATEKLPHEREFVKLLRARLPHVVSIQQNIQTYRNNVILGRETKLLWGRPTIKDRIGRLNFHISPRSFFQVNTAQAEVLYSKALEFANLTGAETVIDAYCGTGTITLFLAQKAREVYGVEIVKPAIQDAKKNARDNNVKNATFLVGDATAVLPRLAHQGVRADVVVVDPPRAGCTPVVLQTFANMHPDRIVYVSCNPASLARDLAILDNLGYHAEKVQPVDMFPETSHVESVTKLVKKR
ncbi:23S rRNA (uracil(1939)-C(5))-methyltransferase RlmD [uncultured Selenomonas sp.]|uniref:23S rRNA (uracil(1939)-C(5))-methyltransferase RlmD n=1 Tax=uncultured Selenomonas sp. TaxID=159275 RepID=UPI0025D53B91|nr:23S rRNA (uracil(1939)-C(5))-methyltransferase RlmD [uncultured Selenomonas sp.]